MQNKENINNSIDSLNNSIATLSDDYPKSEDKESVVDPSNASFSIDDIFNYGDEYESCMNKYDNHILSNFFSIFQDKNINVFSKKISPYKKEKITWFTCYEKVFRKIIPPILNKNENNFYKDFITLEEVQDRINIILHCNEEYLNKKKVIENIKKEKENFVPKLMTLYSFKYQNHPFDDKINENEEEEQRKNDLNEFLIKRRKKRSNSIFTSKSILFFKNNQNNIYQRSKDKKSTFIQNNSLKKIFKEIKNPS